MLVCSVLAWSRRVGHLMFMMASLLWLQAGCAGTPGEPKPPSVEGSEWIQLETSHFQLQTDLPEPEARELMAEFHRRAHALSWALLRKESLPSFHSRIVAFDEDRAFAYFVHRGTAGIATSGLPYEVGNIPTIVQPGDVGDASFRTFQHELTHRVLFEAFGVTPPWLSEGMASYYGTLEERDGVLSLGEQPQRWTFSRYGSWKVRNRGSHFEVEVPVSQLVEPSRLVSLDGGEFYPGEVALGDYDVLRERTANYASSWALVHLLLNGPEPYRERFGAVLADVAQGGSTEDALDELLGSIPPEQLDDAFYKHVQASERTVWRAELPGASPSPEVEVRSMADAEVLLLWAKLGRLRGRDAQAGAWLEAAAAADPQSPKVLLVSALADLEQDAAKQAHAKLEQAHERDPDDGDVLAVLSHLYAQEPAMVDSPKTRAERLARWTKQLAAMAEQAHEFQAAALGLQALGQLQTAHVMAQQAVRSDPNCWSCFDTLAGIRYAQGDAATAVELQEIAVARAWERSSPEARQRLQARLQRFRSDPPPEATAPSSEPTASESPPEATAPSSEPTASESPPETTGPNAEASGEGP